MLDAPGMHKGLGEERVIKNAFQPRGPWVLPWFCDVSLLDEKGEATEVNRELGKDGDDGIQVEDVR